MSTEGRDPSKPDASVADDVADIVGDKKKKKKSGATKANLLAEMTDMLDDDDKNILGGLTKPKKKKNPVAGADGAAGDAEVAASSVGAAAPTDSSYGAEADAAYDVLLKRLYAVLRKGDKDASAPEKHVIRRPQVQKDGAKKSAFTNFREVCRDMHREKDMEHVLAFILSELQTSSAMDANDCLILRGKFNSQQLESVLRKYITDFVMCPQCHGISTHFERNPTSRVYTQHCETCRATRTVMSIQSGYRAQVGRRKRVG